MKHYSATLRDCSRKECAQIRPFLLVPLEPSALPPPRLIDTIVIHGPAIADRRGIFDLSQTIAFQTGMT